MEEKKNKDCIIVYITSKVQCPPSNFRPCPLSLTLRITSENVTKQISHSRKFSPWAYGVARDHVFRTFGLNFTDTLTPRFGAENSYHSLATALISHLIRKVTAAHMPSFVHLGRSASFCLTEKKQCWLK